MAVPVVGDSLAVQLDRQFPWRDTDCYLCNQGGMIRDVQQLLAARGVAPAHIYNEAFHAAVD